MKAGSVSHFMQSITQPQSSIFQSLTIFSALNHEIIFNRWIEQQDTMKVTIIDVAIVHFFVRFVLILTTASEIYIVMPSTGSGGAFDAIYGDSRDISQVVKPRNFEI
jgi:hypothetical protein